MRTIFKPRHAVFAALLLGSAIALSATPEPPRVAVGYQDLDLSNPADASVLYSRISRAASEVCDRPDGYDLNRMMIYDRCFKTAVTNAVQSVNAKTLTALHEARMQRTRVG